MNKRQGDDTIELGKEIINLLGGDRGITELGARAISTIPYGLTMMIGAGSVAITKAEHCWNVTVSGDGWVQGGQVFHDVADGKLRETLDALIKLHKTKRL